MELPFLLAATLRSPRMVLNASSIDSEGHCSPELKEGDRSVRIGEGLHEALGGEVASKPDTGLTRH